MNRTKEWLEIMAGFRGIRLQVHGDIDDGIKPVVSVPTIQEALGWLVYHRLVWHDGQRYIARPPAEARAVWERHGLARLEAAEVSREQRAGSGEPEVEPKPAAAPEVPRVHAYQKELFT